MHCFPTSTQSVIMFGSICHTGLFPRYRLTSSRDYSTSTARMSSIGIWNPRTFWYLLKGGPRSQTLVRFQFYIMTRQVKVDKCRSTYCYLPTIKFCICGFYLSDRTFCHPSFITPYQGSLASSTARSFQQQIMNRELPRTCEKQIICIYCHRWENSVSQMRLQSHDWLLHFQGSRVLLGQQTCCDFGSGYIFCGRPDWGNVVKLPALEGLQPRTNHLCGMINIGMKTMALTY